MWLHGGGGGGTHLETTSPSPADWGEEGEASAPRAHVDSKSWGQPGGLAGLQPPKEGEARPVMVSSSLPWTLRCLPPLALGTSD